MAVRTAHAEWVGALEDGSGKMALGSGAFEGQFSYASRFEEGTGTNPEELIGAAHAGGFSMAFANTLLRRATIRSASKRAPAFIWSPARRGPRSPGSSSR